LVIVAHHSPALAVINASLSAVMADMLRVLMQTLAWLASSLSLRTNSRLAIVPECLALLMLAGLADRGSNADMT